MKFTKEATKSMERSFKEHGSCGLYDCFEVLRYYGDAHGSDIFQLFSKDDMAQIIYDQTKGIPWIIIYKAIPKKMNQIQFEQWKSFFGKSTLIHGSEAKYWKHQWNRYNNIVWC